MEVGLEWFTATVYLIVVAALAAMLSVEGIRNKKGRVEIALDLVSKILIVVCVLAFMWDSTPEFPWRRRLANGVVYVVIWEVAMFRRALRSGAVELALVSGDRCLRLKLGPVVYSLILLPGIVAGAFLLVKGYLHT